MQPQTQSIFFGKLPVEIRSQIQVDYLFSYLHIAAIQENQLGSGVSSQFSENLKMTDRFSMSPSPLSKTCKRMREEMRQDTGLVDARGLAVFCVAPELQGLGLRMGLATEGEFHWDRLRRLLFINELDYPTKHTWPPLLARVLQSAPHLTTLEMEWSPRMSLTRTDPGTDALVKIAKHPAIRTIRVRGNVPKSWLEEFATMPGKDVIVESLLWEERDPEEAKQVDRQRIEALEQHTAKGHAFYERQERRNFVDIPKKKKTKWASATCLSCTIL
ncbi:Fc.00g097920.m01.CDS01 [Cosmosporella sp. VM-42]